MQTIRYQTNIKNRKAAHSFRIQLQQTIADFVIRFERQQNDYILVLKGNRAVPDIIIQAFNKEGVDYRLLNEPTN